MLVNSHVTINWGVGGTVRSYFTVTRLIVATQGGPTPEKNMSTVLVEAPSCSYFRSTWWKLLQAAIHMD